MMSTKNMKCPMKKNEDWRQKFNQALNKGTRISSMNRLFTHMVIFIFEVIEKGLHI